jgi:hypothetical protein
MSKRTMGWVYAGKYKRRATLQKRRLEALVDAKVAAELKKLHLQFDETANADNPRSQSQIHESAVRPASSLKKTI